MWKFNMKSYFHGHFGLVKRNDCFIKCASSVIFKLTKMTVLNKA